MRDTWKPKGGGLWTVLKFIGNQKFKLTLHSVCKEFWEMWLSFYHFSAKDLLLWICCYVLGKGAWQNWSYQLSVRDVVDELVQEWKEINSTYYTVYELKPGREYVVKVAAYTSTGPGPWSSEFRGKTLRQNHGGHTPTILWSAAEGLLRSDVTGEGVETLIHRDNLKVSSPVSSIFKTV